MIASSFPPNSSVGGVRPAYFFKYFNEASLDTHVLTIRNDQHNTMMDIPFEKNNSDKIHYIDYSQKQEIAYIENRSLKKKLRDFFNPTYSSPPGLLDEVLSTIETKIDISSFDLIIATVPDMWTASLASYLNKKYNIKYFVDFRDASEQEIGMPRSLREKLQVLRFKKERKEITKNASELITVSNYLAKELQKNLKKKTSVVYNGFDENLFKTSQILESKKIYQDTIKIVYIGRILNVWYRNPLPLIDAIKEMNIKNGVNKKFELHFYGAEKEIIKTEDHLDWIHFHDRVPHNEVNTILNAADILLVLTNNKRRGILTTKLFEYMPINKPIICLPNDDVELANMIEENGLGFSLKNKEEIKSFLQNLDNNLELFKSNSELRKQVNFYTRKNQSIILAKYVIDFLK